MKKLFMFAMAAVVFVSCDKDETVADSSFAIKPSGADYGSTICSRPVKTVSGTISSYRYWNNDTIYEIEGVLRVKAELEIEAGTFIKAKPLATGVATGVLAITKTGTINAVGTSTNPIVFTSYKLLDCDAATTASPGDFGGVILLGDAPVNTGSVTNIIEGLGDQSTPSDFYFGGTNSTHDAGALQYVRIEFAGRKLTPDVEINGLTLGGVGNAGLNVSTTKIHHIQISYGSDDSYEWFGGTVNAHHLISFAPEDDNFDFDWGYTGSINYAVALADNGSTHSASGGNPDTNGIELDNDANSSTNTPFTRPVINHLSVIGVTSTFAPAYENGIHIRRNGRLILLNSTVAGYGVTSPSSWAIRIESPSLAANSSFSNVGVNAYRATPFTTPSPITNVTEVTGTNFGMTQPFFNSGTLDFSGATNGAFVDGDWASPSVATWTKYASF